MSDAEDNLAIARRYLKAIETGASGDEIVTFFAPQAVVEILPSLYFPHGSRSNLDEVRAGAERGKKVMSSQRYEVKNELANGDQTVLEVDWTGTLAVPFQNIPVGGVMRAKFAVFLRFKNGKIVFQRNYDCYEPA